MRAGLVGGGARKKDSDTYGPLTCPYRSTFRAVGMTPRRFDYGMLPPRFFAHVRDRILQAHQHLKLSRIPRSPSSLVVRPVISVTNSVALP